MMFINQTLLSLTVFFTFAFSFFNIVSGFMKSTSHIYMILTVYLLINNKYLFIIVIFLLFKIYLEKIKSIPIAVMQRFSVSRS